MRRGLDYGRRGLRRGCVGGCVVQLFLGCPAVPPRPLDASVRLASAAAPPADPLLGSAPGLRPFPKLRNFSPGPTSIPPRVMERIAKDPPSYQGCGLSAMELSHRSPEFLKIKDECEAGWWRLVFAGTDVGDDFGRVVLPRRRPRSVCCAAVEFMLD